MYRDKQFARKFTRNLEGTGLSIQTRGDCRKQAQERDYSRYSNISSIKSSPCQVATVKRRSFQLSCTSNEAGDDEQLRHDLAMASRKSSVNVTKALRMRRVSGFRPPFLNYYSASKKIIFTRTLSISISLKWQRSAQPNDSSQIIFPRRKWKNIRLPKVSFLAKEIAFRVWAVGAFYLWTKHKMVGTILLVPKTMTGKPKYYGSVDLMLSRP